MDDEHNLRISVPKPELAQLSFAIGTPDGMADWAAQLPMANTGECAQQLAMAASEVARLATDGPNRLGMLEELRSPLHYICTRLDREAITNPNHGDRIGQAAQQLQSRLTTGYKAVVRDLLPLLQKQRGYMKNEMPTAIHRALSDTSRTLLRTFQLYVSPPKDLWRELNQLYYLAEQLKLHTVKVDDEENHSGDAIDIADAYLRPVMLSLSKPNQLRYENLTKIFNALELWCPRINVEDMQDDTLFAVDLGGDDGPTYANMLGRAQKPRGIRTSVLVYEIEAYLKEIDSKIPIPDYIDEHLLTHLASSWGKMTQRSFKRLRAEGELKVCVGLSSAHYFVSGGVDFKTQVGNNNTMLQREINPFGDRALEVNAAGNTQRNPGDVWEDAFDLRVRIPENPNIGDPEAILDRHRSSKKNPEPDRNKFRFFDTQAIDTSPGGYCIRWNGSIPTNLRTGELISLRDATDPRWCVAVIRWIRQDDETTMGIELLAPRAIPVASRVIQKRGGPTDYARALLLPELKPINQPATLITPAVPFAPEQKIHLQRQGIQTTAQLMQCVLSTESFKQFTFRMLDGYLENAQIDLNIQSLSEMIGAEEPDSPL